MYPELFPFYGGTCIDSSLKMPFELIGNNGFCSLKFTQDALDTLASANIVSLNDLLLFPKADASRCFAKATLSNIEDMVTDWLYSTRRTIEINVQRCLDWYLAADVDGSVDEPWHELPFFSSVSLEGEDGIKERFPCTLISVHSLGLTVAVLSGLLNNSVCTLAQLLASPEGKLTSIPYLGQNKLNKLKVTVNACMFKWVNGDEECVTGKCELPNFALFGGTLTQMPEELRESARSEFPVSALPLSTMAKNRLREGGIYFVGSLLTLFPQELASNCRLSGYLTDMVIQAVRTLLFTNTGDLDAEQATPNWLSDEHSVFRDTLQLAADIPDKDVDVSVSRLNLSNRAMTVMNRLRIKTVGELLEARVGVVTNARGAGTTTIRELHQKLEEFFNPTFISMDVSGLSELLSNYLGESLTKTESVVYNARCARGGFISP